MYAPLPDSLCPPPLAGAVGGFLVGAIGVLLPPVMFWGEWEIQTIADGTTLPHIWPKGASQGWIRRAPCRG